jgi:mannitol-1-phosphate 5-dehydrogenase
MVPLVSSADIAADPLRLFAEAYETLIVDKTAFHGGPPDIPGLRPVEHIAAWVDRKLFVHNLGHAATAYIGYQTDPRVPGISGALRLPGVEAAARAAMNASADALALEYPGSYTRAELAGHIDDLIARFGNSALGDTVFRVGRDRGRKLSRGDRVTGAMLLCARKGVGCAAIARVYRAALAWTAVGEDGKRSAADEVFDSEVLAGMSPDAVINSASALAAISGLAGSSAEERTVLETLRRVSAPQS